MRWRSASSLEGAATASLVYWACATGVVEGFVGYRGRAALVERGAERAPCSAFAPTVQAATAARKHGPYRLSLHLSIPLHDNDSRQQNIRWRLKDMGPSRVELLQGFSESRSSTELRSGQEERGFVEDETTGCVGRGKEGGIRKGFLRPAAVVRFVREVMARGSRTGKGMKARVLAWRRAMSTAFVGVATAAVIVMATVGPAFAAAAAAKPKRRMTDMPEHCYKLREDVMELMQMDPIDRAIDFTDLTIWSEELDKLDMFGDQVAVPYHTKESLRLKYWRVLEDIASGGQNRGIMPALKIGGLAVVIGTAVASVSFSVGWVLKSFLSMASEEEVHLYGEEISVDATEKPPDELEGLLPEDDVDPDAVQTTGEDTSGSSPSPPTGDTPPDVEGGGFSSEEASSTPPPEREADAADDDDDLLGM